MVDRTQIAKLRQKGQSFRKIAAEVGVSSARVHQIVAKDAPELLGPYGKHYVSADEEAMIIGLRVANTPMAKIASTIGRSEFAVSKVLHDLDMLTERLKPQRSQHILDREVEIVRRRREGWKYQQLREFFEIGPAVIVRALRRLAPELLTRGKNG
jgi:IS30 family transposase